MLIDNQQLRSLKEFLDCEAARINSVDFIASDPVQFPRRFSALRDIEIVSLLSATIAWGNRKMICNNCNKMLEIMQGDPAAFVDDEAYEALPDDLNIHRTFFARNFKYLLRGLRHIYNRYASLNDFAAANGGMSDSRCLPTNLTSTALKRINMALRWFVRNDGIVDMGVWNAIHPSQLFIPLDVHVGNTARALGMIDRCANDKKTVLELTSLLRQFRPDDPVIYDYALFGVGINSKG